MNIYRLICKSTKKKYFCRGELAEWSIAAVLKTVEPRGSGGSNPSLSARTIKKLAERLAFLLLERWESSL